MKFLNSIAILLPFLVFQFSSISITDQLVNSEIDGISIEDIENIAQQDDKKVIIKLSAAWCKPCKKLALTLEDPEIQEYLDDNFHVVDFDIQTKGTIDYQGKTYNYVEDPKMGYHELAYQMLDQRLSFPALLVLDKDLNKIDLTRGYKSKTQLLEYIQAI